MDNFTYSDLMLSGMFILTLLMYINNIYKYKK